jgi:hypothetical protein
MLGEQEHESARDIDHTSRTSRALHAQTEPREMDRDEEVESRRAASLEEARAGFMLLDL